MEEREILARESLRVNDEFLELLSQDCAIGLHALRVAFMGIPRDQATSSLSLREIGKWASPVT